MAEYDFAFIDGSVFCDQIKYEYLMRIKYNMENS